VVQDPTGAIGPYAYKGNQWVSYDDVAMIRKKSQLIRDLGLGGGMVWALDLDDFRNTCGQGSYPLLTTIKNVLGKPKNSDSNNLNKEVIKRPPIRSTSETPYPVQQPVEPVGGIEVQEEVVGKEDPCRAEPFRPHESDCSKYYMCLFGRYIEYQCAPGTYWSKVSYLQD